MSDPNDSAANARKPLWWWDNRQFPGEPFEVEWARRTEPPYGWMWIALIVVVVAIGASIWEALS